jgi:CubicO group peptidase (beta-lactamase class C family)
MNRLILIAATALLVVPTPAQAGELPRAKPEAVGLAAGKIADLKPSLQKIVDEGKISGGVALVARHGRVAYLLPFGFRDLAGKTPMTEDTIFAIASMTKPITCLAVMKLVEKGKLGLDDPVGKYLPELKDMRVLGDPKDDTGADVATVPAKRPITVRDLLSHTSGFSYGATTAAADDRLGRSYNKAGVQDATLKTIAERVSRLGRVALAHQPGEGWTYGYSHDVLGRLIEVVTGQSFADHLEAQVLRPLDMRDTAFFVPEGKRDRLATTYEAAEGKALKALPKEFGSETYFGGGGGLFSTARDYARFTQMLLNGGELDGVRVVKPETVADMTRNQIGANMAFGERKYGLGFGLLLEPEPGGKDPVLIRYYWGGIYSTNFWVDPRHDLAGIIMTQVVPLNHGDANRVFHLGVNAAIEK